MTHNCLPVIFLMKLAPVILTCMSSSGGLPISTTKWNTRYAATEPLKMTAQIAHQKPSRYLYPGEVEDVEDPKTARLTIWMMVVITQRAVLAVVSVRHRAWALENRMKRVTVAMITKAREMAERTMLALGSGTALPLWLYHF